MQSAARIIVADRHSAEARLTAREFETRFDTLLREARGADNTGCIECPGCRGCAECTFCRDSENLLRCHYCVRCVGATDCQHCRDSRSLIGCSHCSECEGCTAASYCVRSVGLSSCTYCFGCVGLRGRDFHILNEPYDRTEYFEVTRRLMRELGM